MTTFVEPSFWAIRRRGGYLPLRAVSTVITGPVCEPVSLTEVKNRLRISSNADDADLSALIIAARQQIEKDLGADLVSRLRDTWFDRLPSCDEFEVPRWPLQSITSLTSYDTENAATVMTASDYLVDTVSRPGRIILNASASWPTTLRAHKAIAVRHTSGFSGTTLSVSSVTRSGAAATATTAVAHGYVTGNRITMAGFNQAEYDGTFEIVVTGANTFTFTVTGTPVTPATGVMTATDLGIPVLYTLAITVLVGHWWDKIRTGLTSAGAEVEIPFAYSALISDAPEHLA